MTVLHINSSVRFSDSNTRIIGQYLLDALGEPTISRDLAQHPLPPINAEDLVDLHSSSNSDRASLQAQFILSEQLIGELKNADTLVLAAPIYNFGIPATLKQWIDASGSKRAPDQVIAQGKQQVDALMSTYSANESTGAT
ncbi:MAG: NAD(P)H-dependent oxidoreductase [Marinobacter sp.]